MRPVAGAVGPHLKLFQRQKLIKLWHDRLITAGQEWKGELDDNLERPTYFTPGERRFHRSDYCYDLEMTRASGTPPSRRGQGPSHHRADVNWRSAPFGKLQALPKGRQSREALPDRDNAWRQVADGIEKLLKKFNEKSPY